MASYGQTQSTLWGPVQLTEGPGSTDGLEISVHTLPKQLQREFHHVFPESNLPLDDILTQHDGADGGATATAEFLALPTNQHAREDLVAMGEKIEREKDRLLNVFMQFARALCERIVAAGYWADFIDPCSGLPMLTLNCNK